MAASTCPSASREQAGGAAARVDPALGADARWARRSAAGSASAARCCSATGRSATCGSTAPCPRRTRAPRPRRGARAPIAPIRRSPPSSPAPRSRRRRCPSGPPDSWTLIQRARASFDPLRSGDFYVMLKPRITPIADASRGSVATHGSVWDYDRRVPILFWRRGMTGVRAAAGGRDGRHHADPRRPDRPAARARQRRRPLPRSGRGTGDELPELGGSQGPLWVESGHSFFP